MGRDLDAPDLPANAEVLVGGMGGSGIAGDFGAALATETEGRVAVHKGYSPLPGWVRRVKPTLIAASYSGNTEETLDLVNAAGAAGRSTGDHRGAAGRTFSPKCLAHDHGPDRASTAGCGRVFGRHSLQALGHPWRPPRSDRSSRRGGGPGRCATTEGSKRGKWRMGSPRDCWAGSPSSTGRPDKRHGRPTLEDPGQRECQDAGLVVVLPELDHNEIVGWETLPSLTRDVVGIVSLTDIGDHARSNDSITRRNSPRVPWIGEVQARGDRICPVDVTHGHRGPRVHMLAGEAGVDPVPVETIEKLKKLLVKD